MSPRNQDRLIGAVGLVFAAAWIAIIITVYTN